MEIHSLSPSGVAHLPARDLWGRAVHASDGIVLGTIDSVIETVGGSRKAMLRNRRAGNRFLLVDLTTASLHGDDLVMES